MQNQPSLCVTLAIIFAWLLLKLSVTFCIHPMQRKITAWLGETRRNCKGGTSQKNDISRSLMLLVC